MLPRSPGQAFAEIDSLAMAVHATRGMLDRSGIDPDALKSELQDMVSSGLNPLFKIYRVIVVDELPHTASGKLVRRILRDRMKSGDQASVAQRCSASQF